MNLELTHPGVIIGLAAMAFTTAIALLQLGSLAWTLLVSRRRQTRLDDAALEPVSVLKPLCGVDDDLEANLRTCFEQDHPDFELVFGIVGDDPALPIVQRLRAAYPAVKSRIVIHDGRQGINPKVAQLRAMLPKTSADITVIHDSNVAVEPGWLRAMATTMAAPETGLVSCLIRGAGEHNLGSALDNLHTNGHIAGVVAASHRLLSRPAVIGKSMMFRKSVLDGLGGLESLGTVLAEDYVMGRMFAEAGWRVRLAPHAVTHVNRSAGVRSFYKRHLRWAMMRWRLNPLLHVGELLTLPLASAGLAALLGVPVSFAALWGIFLLLARDGASTVLLRGPRGLAMLPLTVLREALVLATWAIAPFKRHVQWRETRVRLSSGSRVYRTRA